MMDMRQHNGGAMPSNSLQFSPQSALSNDNLFLLDPNFSSSPSMDMCGLNPTFSSQMNSDFSSVFMDSGFSNGLGFNMGSSLEIFQGQGQSVNGFYAADEWSVTSNSASGASALQQNPQAQQQQHLNVLSNQRQNLMTQSSLEHSIVSDANARGHSFENGLSATSQVERSISGNTEKVFHESGDIATGQTRLQGMAKQLSALAQGSLTGGERVQGNQQGSQLDDREASNFHGGFYGTLQNLQSESLMSTNVPGVSSHDETFQHNRALQMQTMELCKHQTGLGNNIVRSGLPAMHGQQGSSQGSVYHGKDADNSSASYPAVTSETLFQTGHGENVARHVPSGPQHGQHQGEQSLQAVRSLALQLQGKSAQSTLQNQLSTRFLSLPLSQTVNPSAQQLALHSQQSQGPSDQLSSLQSHKNNHPLSMLLQSQASAQFQSLSQPQVQSQVQNHGQVQAANQQAAFQARQLQSGPQQPLLQHSSFQSIQPVGVNQVLSGSNHGLHLNSSQQMIAQQMQPRLLSPTFQGLKAGGPQALQTSSPATSANSTESNLRTQMPVAIAARCIQVLQRYIQEQRKRPPGNEIHFWKSLVNDYFVPGATKRWCLSSYNSMPMGRHAQNLFPMDYWFCNLCGVHPGRGFESSTDVLPRLFKIKYASGLEDELLFLDIAEGRYMLPNGRLVLDFPRAVHESKFPELRVVRYGRLRVTFSSSFKIFSWEFCTKMHEEVVPRKDLLIQAQQLAKLVKDCEQEGFEKSAANLKAYCNEFMATARQLASKLEAPSVNDLGFSKRYVRCLQIAEVVNSMKDLISFERKTRSGPISSLANFPCARKAHDDLRTSSTSSQVINPLSQGNASSSASYSNVQIPQQGKIASDLQSAITQNSGVSAMQSSSQAALSNDADLQSDVIKNQFQTQVMHHQMQTQASSQLLTQSSSRSMLSMHGSQFGHGHPHLPAQLINSQTVNYGQLAQQIYESAGNRQVLQPLNQPITHSQSLNHTGQQSLPGTPQSEMSDMRTNT